VPIVAAFRADPAQFERALPADDELPFRGRAAGVNAGAMSASEFAWRFLIEWLFDDRFFVVSHEFPELRFVRAFLQEERGNAYVAARGRSGERCQPFTVARACLGAVLEEEPAHLKMPARRCEEQGCAPGQVLDVDLRSVAKQKRTDVEEPTL
jgi:hypothetical protein